MNGVTELLWCEACCSVTAHTINGTEKGCTRYGLIGFHDTTPCPDRRPDGSTCGQCGVCLAAQTADPRYAPGEVTP